ncbi:flagellar brake protein [Glaciimonas immobilis]|uniref:C-di-GMP-binding flagellar brake protein YcgR n=1 Tax=Glaciimonas immobilis TaxID=728004 RepID=A0A840RUK6_9BURK|nr:flagellar brake protein [Glaciimonas immobilis]KAF3999704.1 flagellar brake protein [Glaciimonas immobilis]MBB5200149.1 c-di-GMP-binding flagellar brake protein YcgR [Glaciimonas immobilis]
MKTTSTVPEIGADIDLPSTTLEASLAALDDFRIVHPNDVVSLLRQLAQHADPLDISFGRRGARIVTRIVAVDDRAGVFYYAAGDSEIENQQHQESGENLFSGMQSGAHVQFVCGVPERHVHEGMPVFISQLPESLYRMQRREHVRFETPSLNPYMCTATLPDQRRASFCVVDVSLAGARLRSTDPTIGDLVIGMTLTDATFDFRDLGELATDLTINFIHNSHTFNDPIHHFGCRFFPLPKVKEAILQRVIASLDLSRKPA